MADTMQFDLVSPEKKLMSGEIRQVQLPGAEGNLTAMPDHAPLITTLRPGVIRIDGGDGESEYIVTGGFAEISAEGVTVLAERAVAKGDMTQEHFDSLVEEFRQAHAKAKEVFQNEPGPVDDAAKLLADMVAMGDEIGLSSRQASL